MKTKQFLILVTMTALFVRCTTVMPKELISARSAYQQASNSPAKELVPAELHKAHDALVLAEQSFQKDPDSYKTIDLAYIAQRKAELAETLGFMAADKSSKEKAGADYQSKQAEIVKQGKEDLIESERETAAAQAEIATTAAVKASKDKAEADWKRAEIAKQKKQELLDAEKRRTDALAAENAGKEKAAANLKQAEIDAQGKQALIDSEKRTAAAQAEIATLAAIKASEEKARAEQKQAESTRQAKQDLSDSEKRTAAAIAELAKIAAIREEERGLIVTLSGNVLFRSDEATLMPSAQVKIEQVAKALLSVPARSLIVEGHTDSQGSESYNQDLSQHRADAVRDYLVQKGYPSNRIQSHGKGKGSPIADNASPEGRANNRRVEIIIEREIQTSSK